MSTFSQGVPIDALANTLDRIRANFQLMSAKGPCPLLAPLQWDEQLGKLGIDTSGLGGVSAADRTGPQNWSQSTGGSVVVFPTLDARLEQIQYDLNLAFYALLVDRALAKIIINAAGYAVSNGSVLKLAVDVLDIANQTGDTSYLYGSIPGSITVGGTFSPASNAIVTPDVELLYVARRTGTGPDWHAVPNTYDPVHIRNLVWQLTELLYTLRTLIADLKTKGVLQ